MRLQHPWHFEPDKSSAGGEERNGWYFFKRKINIQARKATYLKSMKCLQINFKKLKK